MHFKEFINNCINSIIYFTIYNTFKKTCNKIFNEYILYFYKNKLRLKLTYLFSINYSRFITNNT